MTQAAPAATPSDLDAATPRPATDSADDLTSDAGAPLAAGRGITFRSVVIGVLAVVAVCVVTPLNDFIFSDTSLAAGFVPLAGVLLAFFLVIAVNGPLHKWAPRHALAPGELAVVMLMTLVACSIPNWGLMRFLMPTPVAPFHLGAADDRFWTAFSGMQLPKWLFPVADPATGRTDPAAVWFYTRVPRGEQIPWSAWIVPLLAWGTFAAAMLATLVAVARLTLEQWATNERLPYPLVQVQAALIDPPEKGRALNALFRSPLLWIGLGGVFAVHMLTCLNAYWPRYFPAVPLKYDLSEILADEPFSFLRTDFKKAMVSLTVVGVTYFIRSRAAFSLWAMYLIMNLVDVYTGMRQGEPNPAARADEHLGACFAFVVAMLWIGRHQWIAILRGAVGFTRGGGGADRAYRGTLLTALVGVAVMLAWLIGLAGVKWWVAALIVLFTIAAHLVVARVVAETGLTFFRASIGVQQVFSNLPASLFSARDIYFSGAFTLLGPLTSRDSVTALSQQGLGVAEHAGVDPKTRGKALGRVIALALLVGCLVAAPATLYCHYSYPTPTSFESKPARNYLGAELIPQRVVRNPVDEHSRGRFAGKAHSAAGHIAAGAGIVAVLEFLSLRFAAWPLLPVGFVASYGTIGNAWFSIFLGWLAQLIIVRLGGARLFQKARPFFVGIIFGECLAAGVWLLINLVLVLNGYESKSVNFLL
jgi:hypothetical protein